MSDIQAVDVGLAQGRDHLARPTHTSHEKAWCCLREDDAGELVAEVVDVPREWKHTGPVEGIVWKRNGKPACHAREVNPPWRDDANLREGHSCECPVLLIALHKPDLPFTPHIGHKIGLIALRIADMISARPGCHFGPGANWQLLAGASKPLPSASRSLSAGSIPRAMQIRQFTTIKTILRSSIHTESGQQIESPR